MYYLSSQSCSYLISGSLENGKPTNTLQLTWEDMKDNSNHCDLLSNYHGPGTMPRLEWQYNITVMRVSFGFKQYWVPVPVLLPTSCVTLEVHSISVMNKDITHE